MTARNYDYILTVADATGFISGNVILGTTTGTEAYIANVDLANNLLKVKLNNVRQEFYATETITSNSAVTRIVSDITYYDTTTSYNVFFTGITANSNTEVHIAVGNVLINTDEYVVDLSKSNLLLNFNGADEATTTTDASPIKQQTITFNGDAQLDTAQKKFGTASLLLDGTGDYLSIPSSDDFKFLERDSTIEVQMRLASGTTANSTIFSRVDAGTENYYALKFVGANSNVGFVYIDPAGNGDAATNIEIYGGNVNAESFYHVAIVNNTTSNTLSLYVANTRVASTTYTGNAESTISGPIEIGRSSTLFSSGDPFNGHIDDLKYSSKQEYVSTEDDSGFYTFPEQTTQANSYATVTLTRENQTNVELAVATNVAVLVQTANIQSQPFNPAVFTGEETTATTTISSLVPSPFIKEKNAFTQNPIVRLISIYYPGEWYPPNENGNPTEQGAGLAWPLNFPFRIAEINGDYVSDLQYNVTYDGQSYSPYPLNVSSIDTSSDGKISEVTLSAFNIDNILSSLVEDPFISGNNSSNSTVALVNNELVHGIDPRTVNKNPADVGSVGDEAFDTLTRARANGLSYSADIVNYYGKANASFDKNQTTLVNGSWTELKQDSRDLLGGVVEIKTTFMNFLDHWPEYSSVRTITANVVEVINAMPYRVGDNVKSSAGDTEATIQSIEENRLLFLSNPLSSSTSIGDSVFIVNVDADVESYVEDIFKINELESLNITTATFGLVSWLQYFKIVVPKRKYYKNTCQWIYKGEECQYPGPGELPIPGTTSLKSNANPIGADNEIAASAIGDICSKSLEACTIRNNQIHFGGFPATGRTIPRA